MSFDWFEEASIWMVYLRNHSKQPTNKRRASVLHKQE